VGASCTCAACLPMTQRLCSGSHTSATVPCTLLTAPWLSVGCGLASAVVWYAAPSCPAAWLHTASAAPCQAICGQMRHWLQQAHSVQQLGFLVAVQPATTTTAAAAAAVPACSSRGAPSVVAAPVHHIYCRAGVPQGMCMCVGCVAWHRPVTPSMICARGRIALPSTHHAATTTVAGWGRLL
jgi:hypothetical protein